MEVFSIFLFISYILLNFYVIKKINAAYYLKEDRRNLHKKLIWFLPFLGVVITRSFWSQKNKPIEVMHKGKRNTKKGKFSDNWENLTGGGLGGGVD